MIAPEVVEIVFAYFDGQELRTEWDSSLEESLPKGVEIRLTLLEEPFEQAGFSQSGRPRRAAPQQEKLVEYRRFVKLPGVRKPYEAEFPQPSESSTEDEGFGP